MAAQTTQRRTRGASSAYTVRVDDMDIRVARKDVKNVNFRVDAYGHACMSVPRYLSDAQVLGFARERAAWFREHMARAAERQPARLHDWTSGEKLLVWGEEKVFVVREGQDGPACEVEGAQLVVRVPAGAGPAQRRRAVEAWLVEQLRERVRELLPACEQRVGVKAAAVTLRRMKSRWGSCSTATARIRLNTALAECPPRCLETVLVHELCHVLVKNHGQLFQALMDLHMSDWRVWQRWLDEHPPRA